MPSVTCGVRSGDPVARCRCYDGEDFDAGTDDFVLKLSKQRPLGANEVFTAWQKYCGGSCP